MTDLVVVKKTGIKLVYLLLLVIFALQTIALIGNISPSFSQAISPVLGYFIYIYVTLMYLLFSLLINFESSSLERFHIDRFTVATLVLAALVRQKAGLPGESFFLILIRLSGIFVVFTLIAKKPNIPITKLRWVLIGIAISTIMVILISVVELAIRDSWKIMPLYRNSMFSTVSGEIIREFSFGALIEEILFRGFLWGYLKDHGLTDNKVFWVQGIVFWLFHISRIFTPFTFFLVVPLLTIIQSKLTLHSKQLFPAIISHVIVNVVSTMLNLASY
jgi:hypothetical protein